MGLGLAKPEAVFFDWDGTLVDSFDLLHAAHNYTRTQLGIEPFTKDVFKSYFGQPREKLYAEIYGQENIETAKGYFEAYVLEHHVTGLKPVEGAEAVLDVLRKLQVPCGVVTNKKRELVESEIRHYGWEDYFVSVVGAGEAEADKPSAAPLFLAIERSGLDISAKKTWFIGDTDNDLKCAEGAECISVLIAAAPDAADLLEKHEVHLHKNNCSELVEFLLQYMGERLQK